MPITLEAADYWKLRFLQRDIEVAELEAMQRIAAARARSSATYEAMAKKYQFDPARNYRWQDDRCELTVEGEG